MFGVKNEKEFTTLGPWAVSPKYQPDGQLSSVKAKKMIGIAMKKGRNFFEWTHKKVRGKNFYATVLLNRVKADGKTFLQARVSDITEKKKSESALIESEERFNTVVNKTGHLVYDYNFVDKTIKWNGPTEKILGYSIKDLQIMSEGKFMSLIHKKDLPQVISTFKKANSKNTHYITEYRIKKKDGEYLFIQDEGAYIKNGHPQSIRKIGVIRDNSAEFELNRLKTEFISITSHQLRTPLTGVKWFTELLLQEKTGKLNAKQKTYLTKILISNRNLTRLVSDLLDINHIETGRKYEIVKSKTDICDLIYKNIDDNKKIIEDKKIKIQYDKCKCPLINVDKNKILQVINNILDNAIKYSKDKGKIILSCKKVNDKIVVSIQDFGHGIPEKEQERVFEKFYRGSNIKKVSTDGTGLGLYICKAIVEGHKGKIFFTSKLSKGTTFIFELPINHKTNS